MSAKRDAYTNVFDEVASSYQADLYVNYPHYLKWALLKKFTKAGDKCLDVGISTGIHAVPLAQRVGEVHGVDISPNMLDESCKAAENAGVSNLHLYQRSATALEFEDEFFDLVYSYSTLLLIPEPQQAYDEIYRVLKPGGMAIVDITGRFNLSQVFWTRYYKKRGLSDLKVYALKEILSIFEAMGFEVIETHPSGLLDQWKYIPGVHWLKFFERIFHGTTVEPDLDYRVSKRFPGLANRWYFVLRKR